MQNRLTKASSLALACLVLASATAAAQQPDSATSVRRAVERIDRRATVRFAAHGRRPVTGTVTRLTGDSVYVQGFDWPVALPLAGVDTVWEHVGGRDRAVHTGLAVGGLTGAILGGWLGFEICGLSDRADRHCELSAVGGAFGLALLFGAIGGVIAGVSSPRPVWQRRYP